MSCRCLSATTASSLKSFAILGARAIRQDDGALPRARRGNGGIRSGSRIARMAEMIREDRVDTLVDLALHTAGNRLPVFARQPAPVQVASLGYPGSTGLPSIGYRLTDGRVEPAGEEAAWSAEERVRLPDCWCCYWPAGDYPEINALPALSTGGITCDWLKTNSPR